MSKSSNHTMTFKFIRHTLKVHFIPSPSLYRRSTYIISGNNTGLVHVHAVINDMFDMCNTKDKSVGKSQNQDH